MYLTPLLNFPYLCSRARIEMLNIQIRLRINRRGVCSIRVIPVRNQIHSVNIPYEQNDNRTFQRVKNINKASTLKMFLKLSTFQPKINLFLNFYIDTYSTNKVLKFYFGHCSCLLTLFFCM